MGPRVVVHFSSLFTYNCDKCVYLVKWSLPPHKQQVVLPSPYLCMWTMDLHWLSLVILKESHQKVEDLERHDLVPEELIEEDIHV